MLIDKNDKQCCLQKNIYERKQALVPLRSHPSLCNCDVWLFMSFLVTGPCGLRRVSRLPILSLSSPGTHPPVLTQKNRRMKHHWVFFFFFWCPVQRFLDPQLERIRVETSPMEEKRAGGEGLCRRDQLGCTRSHEVSVRGQQTHIHCLLATFSFLSLNIFAILG